jgi:hypothetical protein
MNNLGENVCTCRDRHPYSPLHQPNCPQYSPTYKAACERRDAVERVARPQWTFVTTVGPRLRRVAA